MGWLEGWLFRKQVNITGQSGAGVLYQVKLSIGDSTGGDLHLEGHCVSFPQDIRFTDNDGQTLLDYWIEDLTADPITVWVEVADDLGSNQSIYCYYGKSSESSASSISNTFIFADDFEGASPSDTWNVQTNVECSTDDKYYGSKSLKGLGNVGTWILEDSDRNDINVAYDFARKLMDSPSNSFNWVRWNGYYVGGGASDANIIAHDGSSHNLIVTDALWHTFSVRVTSSKIYWYVDGNLKWTTETSISLSKWRTYGNYGIGYIDGARIRKYNDPEPAYSSAGSEETSPNKTGSDTTSGTEIKAFSAFLSKIDNLTGIDSVYELIQLSFLSVYESAIGADSSVLSAVSIAKDVCNSISDIILQSQFDDIDIGNLQDVTLLNTVLYKTDILSSVEKAIYETFLETQDNIQSSENLLLIGELLQTEAFCGADVSNYPIVTLVKLDSATLEEVANILNLLEKTDIFAGTDFSSIAIEIQKHDIVSGVDSSYLGLFKFTSDFGTISEQAFIGGIKTLLRFDNGLLDDKIWLHAPFPIKRIKLSKSKRKILLNKDIIII